MESRSRRVKDAFRGRGCLQHPVRGLRASLDASTLAQGGGDRGFVLQVRLHASRDGDDAHRREARLPADREALVGIKDVDDLDTMFPIILSMLEVRGGGKTLVRRLLAVARHEGAQHGGTHAIIIIGRSPSSLRASRTLGRGRARSASG